MKGYEKGFVRRSLGGGGQRAVISSKLPARAQVKREAGSLKGKGNDGAMDNWKDG